MVVSHPPDEDEWNALVEGHTPPASGRAGVRRAAGPTTRCGRRAAGRAGRGRRHRGWRPPVRGSLVVERHAAAHLGGGLRTGRGDGPCRTGGGAYRRTRPPTEGACRGRVDAGEGEKLGGRWAAGGGAPAGVGPDARRPLLRPRGPLAGAPRPAPRAGWRVAADHLGRVRPGRAQVAAGLVALGIAPRPRGILAAGNPAGTCPTSASWQRAPCRSPPTRPVPPARSPTCSGTGGPGLLRRRPRPARQAAARPSAAARPRADRRARRGARRPRPRDAAHVRRPAVARAPAARAGPGDGRRAGPGCARMRSRRWSTRAGPPAPPRGR